MFDLTKEQYYIIVGLIAAVIVGSGVTLYNRFFPEQQNEVIIEEPSKAQSFIPSSIVVHISGAVRKKGVYKLRKGDRVVDAIRIAGGVLNSADLDAINLAEPLSDGQRIVISVKAKEGEREEGNGISSYFSKSGGKININTADEKTLDSLPGIGASTAKKIIEYRGSHGQFRNIEEIMEVPGIRQGKFQKIKDLITVY